jgi:DNA ligase-1
MDLYEDRYKRLCDYDFGESGLIKKVDHFKMSTLSEVKKWQQTFEAAGYEGCMVNPNIPYYIGRKTNALLKFKSMHTQDCKIIGFFEGKGRLEGTLGGVIVLQENGLTGEVGSGFTDYDRAYIWEHREMFENYIIEVQFQELTDDGYMRFPVLKTFRNDK